MKNITFLSDCEIQVVFKGHSSWSFYIIAGVPQDSILEPRLFLIFISDLPGVISSQLCIHADGTIIYFCLTGKCNRLHKIKLAVDLKKWTTIC